MHIHGPWRKCKNITMAKNKVNLNQFKIKLLVVMVNMSKNRAQASICMFEFEDESSRNLAGGVFY